jgi:hypothetical protein
MIEGSFQRHSATIESSKIKLSVRASSIRKVHPRSVFLTPEPQDHEQCEHNVAMS